METQKDTHLFLTIIAWLWWVVNAMAYRYVQGEAQPWRVLWWVNFVALALVGGISASQPDGDLAVVTFWSFFTLVCVFGVAGVAVWVQVCRTFLSSSIPNSPHSPESTSDKNEGSNRDPIICHILPDV